MLLLTPNYDILPDIVFAEMANILNTQSFQHGWYYYHRSQIGVGLPGALLLAIEVSEAQQIDCEANGKRGFLLDVINLWVDKYNLQGSLKLLAASLGVLYGTNYGPAHILQNISDHCNAEVWKMILERWQGFAQLAVKVSDQGSDFCKDCGKQGEFFLMAIKCPNCNKLLGGI